MGKGRASGKIDASLFKKHETFEQKATVALAVGISPASRATFQPSRCRLASANVLSIVSKLALVTPVSSIRIAAQQSSESLFHDGNYTLSLLISQQTAWTTCF